MPTQRILSTLAGVLLALACAGAGADSHTRPYSGGALKPADFAMTPPNPPPVHDGQTLKAEVTTEVVLDFAAPTCTTAGGKSVCTPGKVTVSAEVDRSKSWISDPTDKDLIDHEQGHFDEAEEAARKAQAEIDKKTKDGSLKGEGATPEAAAADLEAKLQAIIDRARQQVSDKDKDGEDDYDHDTAHGTNKAKQAEARARQRAALGLPSTAPAQKTGPEAESKTTRSIHFDAATGQLMIDQDFIVAVLAGASGFVPDPLDPVLGAEVVLPSFALVGLDADGNFFFSAAGLDPLLQLVADGGPLLLSGSLPYLIYDPDLNLFHALVGGLQTEDGVSAFVDALVQTLIEGEPALLGIEFRPDLDIAALSLDFTADFSSPATNFVGLRLLNLVSSPAPAVLLLVLLPWLGRRRRAISE